MATNISVNGQTYANPKGNLRFRLALPARARLRVTVCAPAVSAQVR